MRRCFASSHFLYITPCLKEAISVTASTERIRAGRFETCPYGHKLIIFFE